jgi:hypothetical protein
MSEKIAELVWQHAPGWHDLIMLLALAHDADDEGHVRDISIQRLAERCRMDISLAQSVILRLRRFGYIRGVGGEAHVVITLPPLRRGDDGDA